MGGEKMKGVKGRKVGEREKEDAHVRLFWSLNCPTDTSLPGAFLPFLLPLFQELGSYPLVEQTKRTGHTMPAGQHNRSGLSPKIESKLNAKLRFHMGWDEMHWEQDLQACLTEDPYLSPY